VAEGVAAANGIDIWWETFGDPADPSMVLVMGQGAQATGWPAPFCEQLAAGGYHVVRYDNRDTGYSTWFDGPSYTLDDLAADAVALLDALSIERAHLVGASMGGGIVQLVAARHPGRTLSMTSIMSSAGRSAPPAETPRNTLGARWERQRPADPEEWLRESLESWRACAGTLHPFDESWWRSFITEQHSRRPHPLANTHHREASRASGDRRPLLATITAPALIIHGDQDPLVAIEDARACAEAIPGARFLAIEGMGHELPPWTWDPLADAILAHARAAA
jgi:pimeloyl-ACP methyl ester carboxylesterase